MTAEPFLALEGVSQRFVVSSGLFAPRRILNALADVDLALAQGETLGLVGESGSGKSTVGRILLGLLRPSAGEARLQGRSIRELARRDLARRVQPVFQDPYASLNPSRTIEAIVGLPLSVHRVGGDTAERRARVARMLDLVGLSGRFAEAYPGELSGGQRQRVAIARALILEPEALICDEPTSALDVSVQAQILNLLIDLRRTLHLTLLFISHNLAVVEHLADRVAVMYLGRIVEEAATADLFRAPRHPYTRALFASVLTPEPGAGIPAPPLGSAAADPFADTPGCAFAPRCPLAAPACAVRPTLVREGCRAVACHFPLNSEEPADA
jgi:peptide/nickel transport system ATP-binding protein